MDNLKASVTAFIYRLILYGVITGLLIGACLFAIYIFKNGK